MTSRLGTWRFGPFELDPQRRRLLQNGQAVAVTPKAFDVLVLLVERHGQLVLKEEMLKALWPDSFVEEGNLSVQISVLRKRLGDSPEDHRFIITVPGRGYQFVAPINETADTVQPEAPAPPPQIVWRRTEPRSRWRWWAAAAALAAAGMAGSIAARSGAVPKPSPQIGTATRAVDPEVWRLYVRGRHLLGKRTEESLRRGLNYFESALARDPKFAPAHSGVADAHSMLGYFGFEAPLQVLPKAQAAAALALELAPRSAEGHTSRAYILHRYEWRFADAERAFVRAIELQPDYAPARHWYASYLESQRRYDEAIAQSARAEELEPVSPVISVNLAGILSSAQLESRAMAQWSKAIELDQTFWGSHLTLAQIYSERDMPQEAFKALSKSIALSGDNSKQLAALARFHAAVGHLSDARKILATLTARAARAWVSPADIASIHTALGESDKAFEWLNRAVDARDPLLAYMAESSHWRRLRHDARFTALLERVGFSGLALRALAVGGRT